jgi:hypothetical protein
MAERSSDAKHGGFPGQRAENRLADDWPIYVAFMPAVVIGIAAAICFSTASLHDRTLSNAAGVRSTQGDTDDYVEGLARLGIAKLPGYASRFIEEPSRWSMVPGRAAAGHLAGKVFTARDPCRGTFAYEKLPHARSVTHQMILLQSTIKDGKRKPSV